VAEAQDRLDQFAELLLMAVMVVHMAAVRVLDKIIATFMVVLVV
jgi:hypothetical protein